MSRHGAADPKDRSPLSDQIPKRVSPASIDRSQRLLADLPASEEEGLVERLDTLRDPVGPDRA